MNEPTTAFDELVRIFGEEVVSDKGGAYWIRSKYDLDEVRARFGESDVPYLVDYKGKLVVLESEDAEKPDVIKNLQDLAEGEFDHLFGDIVAARTQRNKKIEQFKAIFPETQWGVVNDKTTLRSKKELANPFMAHYFITEYLHDPDAFMTPPEGKACKFIIPVSVLERIDWDNAEGRKLAATLQDKGYLKIAEPHRGPPGS